MTNNLSGNASKALSRMQQQLLRIVASGQPIASMGDSFFVTLQREPFPVARSRDEQIRRWNETREYGQHIARTEISSRNLSTLMTRLIALLATLMADNDPLDQFRGPVDMELPNLTRVVTIFTSHLIAAPHRDLSRYFPEPEMLSRLFCAICSTLAKLPVSHDTVCLYEDLLELLLCLLSEQLTDRCDEPTSPGSIDNVSCAPPYICSVFTCACSQDLMLSFLTRLLSNIEQGPAPPPPAPTSAYPPPTPFSAVGPPATSPGSAPSGGLFGAITGLFASRPPADMTRVADLSSCILGLIASQREMMQPWTCTLLGVQDSIRSGSTLHLAAEGSKLVFPFKKLLAVLQDRIAIPQYAVLLYALLYKNQGFLEYVLAQMDPDRLIVPMLRFIFIACLSTYTPPNAPPLPPMPNHTIGGPSSSPATPRPPPTPHSAYAKNAPPPLTLSHPTPTSGTSHVPYSHVYILTITLLILTSDTSYLETLMTVECPSGVPDWLQDRRATLSPSISLGSLMALVVMRVMQANLAADRDHFLHTNCVAILANLSRSWRNMHAVVALRLVNWAEVVARRFARLKNMAVRKATGAATDLDSDVGSAPHTPGTGVSQAEALPSGSGSFSMPSRRGSMIEHAVLDPSTDLAIYSELVLFLLDIIKAILHPTQLRFNPHLVHALLHKQALLAPVANDESCAHSSATIQATLEYFRQRISGDGGDVLSQIVDLSKTFHPAESVLPALRFEYAEDVDTSAFFVPFIWRAIYLTNPYLAWDPQQPGVFEEEEPLSAHEDVVGLGLHSMSSLSLSWMGGASLGASTRSLVAVSEELAIQHPEPSEPLLPG